MVDKLISIKNCGKFVDFVPATISGGWDGEFRKINTIYGENGMGKTTIAQIFKALQGYSNRMIQKKNIESSDDLKVSLIFANEEIESLHRGWRIKHNNRILHSQKIDIYDRYFNETLYSVHLKSDLYSTIMGNEDVYLQYDLLIKEKNDLREKLKNVKTEIHIIDVKYRGVTSLPCDVVTSQEQLQKQLIQIKSSLTDNNTKLTKEYKKILWKINQHFSEYIKRVNRYLKEFRTDFQICKIFVQKNRWLTFNATLNGVEIHSMDSDDSIRSLEQALSEGDKTALSLSFFFAYLDSLADLDKRIVVFDDPFASFDSRRKLVTIKKLTEIAQKCEQFFLLSHDLVFVKDFCSEKDNRDALNLRITKKGKTNILAYHQVEIDSMTPLRMMIDSLQKFLEEGDGEVNHMRMIAANIRIIMEGILKEKYFDIMDDSAMLGHFLDSIKTSSETKYPYLVRLKTYLPDLNLLNDYSKKYHHSNPGYLSEQISYDELEGMVEKTLDLIHYL